MTQPDNGAVSGEAVEAPQSPEDRLNAAFDDPANHQDDDPDQPPADDGNDDPDAQPNADDDLDDDPDDKAQDDDLPPIDAPVSWDAEAKAIFSDLPREAQEIVSKREAERERFVQQKSQEATRARQEVEQEAYQQLAAYDREVAQQLQQYAQRFEVPEPDLALLATDPHTYALQAKRYQDAAAQRSQAQQQAQAYAQQAEQREAYAQQVREAEEHRLIVESFPEYADPTTGPKLREQLTAVAKELGYPPELIGQARATDIIAMRKVAEMKAKADKYDALNAKNMAKVRAAKGLSKAAKPGAAQAPGAARQHQYSQDREALRQGDGAATQRVLDSFFKTSK